MDQTLVYVMAAFTGVAALALLVQAGLLFSIYKVAKQIQEKVEPLAPEVELLVQSTRNTVDQSRKQIVEITTKANEILDSTKRQLATVEDVVNDASKRAKVQLERVEMVLDDTMSRAHETVVTVHTGIMRPLKELNGVAIGIRAAIGYLARGHRASVAQATSDEEMFI